VKRVIAKGVMVARSSRVGSSHPKKVQEMFDSF
jgi:hypothetical protein